MAETLVAPLLKLITVMLDEEVYLASAARTDLEDLKGMIKMLGEFLEKGNSSEAIDNNRRDDMKQARRIIYDSHDAIDDYMRATNFQWEGLFSYLIKHRGNQTFVSKAREIKTRWRNHRATRETISAMETQGQSSTDHAQSSSASHQSSSIAFSMETDDDLEGIDGPRNQLVQWLTDKNSMPKVIFVHGAQGVGKTSLVGTVLRHKKVKNHFKYYVWVKDLRSYELNEATVEELMQANVELWDLTKKENRGEQVKLEQAFQRMEEDHKLRKDEGRWVLVLDDISKVHVIDSLQNRLDQTHPSVLITTRVSNLETLPVGPASTFRTSMDSPSAQSNGAPPEFPESSHDFQFLSSLKSMFRAFLDSPGAQFEGKRTRFYGFHNFKHVSLSMIDSSVLFRREMFHKGPCPTPLKKVSDSILKKCEGLPLAILATCDLLRINRAGVNGNSEFVDWENLYGRLGEELSKGGESHRIRRMITLRMDHPYGCLYYLSMFPLDCRIRCSTLMRLWMAERFAMQEGSKTSQTIAEENLKKILDRNLVQEVEKTSYGRVRICRVHHLLHEIIIEKSKDDEFAMIVADQKEKWPEIIWRLSFHSKMDPIENDTRVKRLRSLLVFKEVHKKSMTGLLGQVDRLNVLHLEACSLYSFPKGILSLKYLRYLKLRGTSVESIPNGIRHLAHLETLDLKGTGIRELPNGILALKALRHLLVYRSDGSPAGTITKHGVKVPLQLGVLKSLQKLCLIKLDEVKGSILSKSFHRKRYGACLLAELGELEHLQRLGISELKSKDMGPLCSSIEKLKRLEVLHLIAASGEILDLSNVDESKAPPYLQRVQLTGALGTLPNWIFSRNGLTKLVLKARPLNGDSYSQLEGDQLQRLRELPFLKHLELEQAFDAPEMTFEAGKFQELRFLGLDRFDKLASLNVDEGALLTLEKLSLARCQLLTRVPQDITRPRNLKLLELYGMPKQFMIAVERNKEVHERMKVVRKDWNDGTRVEVIKLPANRAGRPSAASASTD